MASALPTSFQPSHTAGAAERYRFALAVSALFHLLLAAVLASEMPQRSVRDVDPVPISARLEVPPVVRPVAPAAVDTEMPLKPRALRRDAGISEDARLEALPKPVPARPRIVVQPLALPQAPDPIVYSARDLDSYPMPVVPLDIERFVDRSAGIPPAEVRLELIIDERGIVNHVADVEPGTPGMLGSELHAMIAATRFIPARKDGRAVKSRVLLSVHFGPGNREH